MFGQKGKQLENQFPVSVVVSINDWAEDEYRAILNPVNQIGFIIQVDYFKASGRFFNTKNFNRVDIEFIIRRLNVAIDWNEIEQTYARSVIHRHRQVILESWVKLKESTAAAWSATPPQKAPRVLRSKLADH